MKKWEYQILMPFDGGNKKKWEDIINEAARAGWRIVPNPCGFIYDRLMLLMEREISNTPTERETKIANIGDSCVCCDDTSQSPTDAWDDEAASPGPPTEIDATTARRRELESHMQT